MVQNIFSTSLTASDAAGQVKPALLGLLGKSDMEKEIVSSIRTISGTPPEQIVSALVEKGIQFGLKLLAAIAIYLIGAWLIRMVKKLLRSFFSRKNTEAAIVTFTMSLVTAFMWVLVVIIAVGALGVETTSLAALLAAGGMAIGMALSGIVQNFAGGLMILIFKPFKAGDYIEAMGYAGTVTEVNITSTKMVTVDNKVIILPNGPLQSGTVDNYSKMDFRRVDFVVGVEYGSDADTVRSALLDIAASDKRVLTAGQGAPADPFVGVLSLNPSSVDFTFRIWTKTADYWGVFFDTNEKIYKMLPERGVKFPFPQVSVHMN